jgi:hypothetical protein
MEGKTVVAYIDNSVSVKREYRPARYDWDRWFDGETWVLTRGEDFDVAAKSFQCQAAAYARTHGITVRTRRIDDRTVAVRAAR